VTQTSSSELFITTIDAASLSTIRWGLMRAMFPRFVEEMELGRYVRSLLSSGRAATVRIEPHRQANGLISEHEFDIYGLA
jgi:hypothetical protein